MNIFKLIFKAKKKIKLSRHAKNRFRKWKFPDKVLTETINTPDYTTKDKLGHSVYWKKTPKGYLKVVCEIKKREIEIITIVLRSKRGKQ